jgi:hypothetical protein
MESNMPDATKSSTESDTPVSDMLGIGSQRRSYIRDISPKMAVESLRCTTCPACGEAKPKMKSLCMPCFRHLPTRLKERLYLKMGKGYEPAIRDALNELHATGIFMPGAPDAPPEPEPGEKGLFK